MNPGRLRRRLCATVAIVVSVVVGALGSSLPVFASTGWSSPVRVSTAAAQNYAPVTVEVGSGRLATIWGVDEGVSQHLESSTSIDGGATWTPPIRMSPDSPEVSFPQLVATPSGELVATWTSNDLVAVSAIETSSSDDFGVTWATPTEVTSPNASATYSSLAVDTAGNLAVAWIESSGTPIVEVAARSVGSSTWTSPIHISNTNYDASNVELAFAPSGVLYASWGEAVPSGDQIIARTSQNLGVTWNARSVVSIPGNAGHHQTMQPFHDGTAVVWENHDNGVVQTFFTSSAASNPTVWSAPVAISPTAELAFTPEFTVQDSGVIVAIWANKLTRSTFSLSSSWSSDSGATWTPSMTISPSCFIKSLRISSIAGGISAATWDSNVAQDEVLASVFSNGNWQQVETVSPPADGNANTPAALTTLSSTGFVATWSNGGLSAPLQVLSSTIQLQPVTADALAATGPSAANTIWLASLLMSCALGLFIVRRARAALVRRSQADQ